MRLCSSVARLLISIGSLQLVRTVASASPDFAQDELLLLPPPKSASALGKDDARQVPVGVQGTQKLRHYHHHHQQQNQRDRYADVPEKAEGSGVFSNKAFRRRPFEIRSRPSRPPVRPERHETCDDDLDCRRSPSQICIKRAREPKGRCQCPFYRPVEVAFNGVVRCVTAKDLFDECRATEECTVSNRYLQCANRLCVCTAPYVLSQHDECGPATGVHIWLAWVLPIAAVLLGAVSCAVSRRGKSGSSNSESQNDESSLTARAPFPPAPRPADRGAWRVPAPQVDQPDGSGYTSFPQNDVLRRSKKPTFEYNRVRDWARLPRGAESPASGSGPDPIRVMWAQQAFRSMASPIYQSKLLRRLLASPDPKSKTKAYLKTSRMKTQPNAARGTNPPLHAAALFRDSARELPAPYPDAPRREDRLAGSVRQQQQQRPRPGLPFTRSEDVASFRSFPMAGRESAKMSAHDVREDGRPMRGRSPPERLASCNDDADDLRMASSDDDAPRTPRKVSFARYQ